MTLANPSVNACECQGTLVHAWLMAPTTGDVEVRNCPSLVEHQPTTFRAHPPPLRWPKSKRARALGFRAGYFRIQDPEKQHQTNPGIDGLSAIIENLWMAFLQNVLRIVLSISSISFRSWWMIFHFSASGSKRIWWQLPSWQGLISINHPKGCKLNGCHGLP